MPTPTTLLLASGGVRSLVATASILSQPKPPRLMCLHMRLDSPDGPRRRERMHQQCEHYKLAQAVELSLPRQEAGPRPPTHEPGARPPLLRPRLLLAAVSHALLHGAQSVIWPGQFGEEFDAIARITEQMVLVQHIAQIESNTDIVIDTPLLELSDPQVVELGSHLNVPWELAWSCQLGGELHCGACPGCLRRRQAFETAGIVDPLSRRHPRGDSLIRSE
jgi:7-cyano-7-deazaguanine synthase